MCGRGAGGGVARGRAARPLSLRANRTFRHRRRRGRGSRLEHRHVVLDVPRSLDRAGRGFVYAFWHAQQASLADAYRICISEYLQMEMAFEERFVIQLERHVVEII